MKKIIFVGGVWDIHQEKTILKDSIGAIQNAANVFQWNIIKGLDDYSKNGVDIISAPFIGAFPFRYRKLYVSNYKFNHTSYNCHEDKSV